MTFSQVLVLLLVFCSVTTAADKPLLWEQPQDVTSRDLSFGSGGKDGQPVGPFTFTEEDLEGTNPKFDVRDAHGTKWKVKLGEEPRPETAASRFVWAVGYPTYDYYFLPSIAVQGLPGKLKRGNNLRQGGSTFVNVRLKRAPKGTKKNGVWRWKDNPFTGTREFNGLRTLMAVLNNWDLKDENNALLESTEGVQIYVVSDLGASFGTDHLVSSHEVAKGNLDSYTKSQFIVKKGPETVDFGTPGKPSAKFIFNPKDGAGRVEMEWIGRGIPLADARWMGELLGQLTPAQIRDAFRGAGFEADQVEGYAVIMERRIAELKGL